MVSIVKNAFGLTAFRTLAVAFALLARYKIVPISVENEKEVNKTSGTFKNRQKFENHQRVSKNQNHVKITPIFRDTYYYYYHYSHLSCNPIHHAVSPEKLRTSFSTFLIMPPLHGSFTRTRLVMLQTANIHRLDIFQCRTGFFTFRQRIESILIATCPTEPKRFASTFQIIPVKFHRITPARSSFIPSFTNSFVGNGWMLERSRFSIRSRYSCSTGWFF